MEITVTKHRNLFHPPIKGGNATLPPVIQSPPLKELLKTVEWLDFLDPDIPRSRHNPKILGVDDAEIVGDRITKVRPITGNCFTQETERRIGELGASCVALVVRDMLVHHAP